jgi:ectoine hydroxylase-related dioxygenase (phytanoyl-CoA dioxygenase family)
VLGDIPFLQYFNVWREDEVVRSLSTSPELAELASSLMRVRRVRLYQDSLFLKRVGDGCTNYHSDLRMAPFDTNDFVTFWIPLVDIPRFGSALVFVSGSHNDIALNFWRSRKQVANMDLSKR